MNTNRRTTRLRQDRENLFLEATKEEGETIIFLSIDLTRKGKNKNFAGSSARTSEHKNFKKNVPKYKIL